MSTGTDAEMLEIAAALYKALQAAQGAGAWVTPPEPFDRLYKVYNPAS